MKWCWGFCADRFKEVVPTNHGQRLTNFSTETFYLLAERLSCYQRSSMHRKYPRTINYFHDRNLFCTKRNELCGLIMWKFSGFIFAVQFIIMKIWHKQFSEVFQIMHNHKSHASEHATRAAGTKLFLPHVKRNPRLKWTKTNADHFYETGTRSRLGMLVDHW